MLRRDHLPLAAIVLVAAYLRLAYLDLAEFRREEAWKRLETDLDPAKLQAITTEIGLGEVIATAPRILGGGVRGRIVVKIG